MPETLKQQPDREAVNAHRSSGGKLALWAFWLFCIWFACYLLHFIWVVSQPTHTPLIFFPAVRASTIVEWAWILMTIFTSGLVGVILGAIAWYTRPS